MDCPVCEGCLSFRPHGRGSHVFEGEWIGDGKCLLDQNVQIARRHGLNEFVVVNEDSCEFGEANPVAGE